tara:strand:- start:44 stop:226 length:183 start_codon:yes stop_codon:yes gene_type:complete
MVKKVLDMKGAQYEVINLDEQPEKEEEAIKVSGGFTAVPITTNGETVVVGWNPSKIMGLL